MVIIRSASLFHKFIFEDAISFSDKLPIISTDAIKPLNKGNLYERC